MNFIWDKITEWLKGLLVSGIISNLSGLFDAINTRVGEAAAVVGTTPQAWHGGIFQMIRSLSENVVVPIAGIILTFIMCLELIQMLIDRNSLHDFDTFLFFKWIFKTFAAVLIVTNTWNIVMAVFDVAQNVVSQASGIIIGDTALDAAALLGDMEQALMAMEIGPLFGLWFQSSLMGILAWVLSICIFIVIYGRMIVDFRAFIPFELCNIRQPFFIRLLRMEIPVQLVFCHMLRTRCTACAAVTAVLNR